MIIEPEGMPRHADRGPQPEVEWMLNTQMLAIQNGFLERLRFATAATDSDARLVALQHAKQWAAVFLMYADFCDKRLATEVKR